MKLLFLDDNEVRQKIFYEKFLSLKKDGDVLIQTRTVEETIDALKTQGPFDIIDLDHDLDGRVFVKETEGTGYQVTLFIENELPDELLPKHVIIHTRNYAGAQRMMMALARRVTSVQYEPWSLAEM